MRPDVALRIPAAGLSLLLALGCGDAAEIDATGPVAGWPEYGGAPGGGRFSPLTQIAPANVGRLRVAWTYHTGDVLDGSSSVAPSSFQNTPILAFGALHLCTPRNRVIALDPETGTERWRFDPQVDVSRIYVTACRGVSAWEDARARPEQHCGRRIFTGTLDARLIALDAGTGQPCPGFGAEGEVDLGQGIGDRRPGEYGVTSPPLVVRDLVVVGSMVLDNRRVDAPGGVVRAYDARSGRLRWAWDPVPPGALPAAAGAPSRWRRGTTNVWSILSADPALGLVYAPTGNAAPDYFGGERGGLDHYSSSVVALDAASGDLVWHFRTVHHDVWDYDTPAQPTLFSFPAAGGAVPALVQATKMGHLFFLDRRDGRPLFPVEERPVPQGAAPGESLAPTQPFPTRPAPIHPSEPLRPDDAFGFTFWDRGHCRDAIAALRSEGLFTPPSLRGSVHYPGMMGGANWGSPAIDPGRGLLIVNTSRVATLVRLVPRASFTPEMEAAAFGFEPVLGSVYAVERRPLVSPFGAPCNPPPWGTLVAIDVASGELRWEVPLGTTRDMAPFPIWLFAPEGVPNQGGPVATASGLTFIAATSDAYLRAFDTASGDELWRGRLPFPGQATPMTYRTGPDARQFVVIAAGGHGIMGTPVGDAVVAFALP